MKVIKTPLEGCLILEPRLFEDERGYFFESYNQRAFSEAVGRDIRFVQDNQSFSKKGVIRALHYQTGEFAQAKLVRVSQGRVLDVAVDLRPESPTFGQHFSIELSEENNKQLFIPKGFAHGFAVLSDTADFCYKCDNYYAPESEGGIIYNDPTLNIDWGIPEEEQIVSPKDAQLPPFKALVK
ncbi:dTDP-4-dehydrorhamnose 3,5-epimerase [Poritiphilus flavus]|uniref:dTDP-4-dehydrorhamnose 3,5-epimerase n=1 Tax=Poritiphilus flavus TaxID=2697053 RepID=A0A6L9E8P5_9FLAO|nr:dTDP-4-dehydrorhamnose 3,5-epimerase [Poritiphilus flavus]NAS10981.1 dTDP-4-dehydrorhamnose 3,5-epimerase [Poritiphilus flavus]